MGGTLRRTHYLQQAGVDRVLPPVADVDVGHAAHQQLQLIRRQNDGVRR
jgi:hypothetical protein